MHRVVCAGSDAGTALKSSRPGATTTLVPAGADRLTICRYNGMNALGGVPQWGLRGTGLTVDAKTVTALARALDALKPTPPNTVTSCPMDDDSYLLAFFGYPSGVGDPVSIDTGGCATVTNGHLNRMWGGSVAEHMLRMVKSVKLGSATLQGTISGCIPSQLAAGDCPDPSDVIVRMGNRWIGLAQVVHGHFRLRLAIGGRATVQLRGEGQRVNALVATANATIEIGHTTRIVLVPAPFGTVSGEIRNCGQTASTQCSTKTFPDAMSVRVQTPTQRDGHNLITFQPMSDRFTIPLPPGSYRFTVLNENYRTIAGVTGSMITVLAHHTTDAVLTIPKIN
jgi:hypothetical protein